MPSFRSRVLDALDIKKDHVRIPTFSNFPSPPIASAQSLTSDENSRVKCGGVYEPFAISQTIKRSNLGPSSKTDKLDILGFVVGEDPGHLYTTDSNSNPVFATPNPLPDALNRNVTTTQSNNQDYTGIHYLGGLYDSTNEKLQSMRASSMVPKAHQSIEWYGTDATAHTHKDWPSDRVEQAQKLQDDPYADSLYYHSTKLRFFLTGLDDVATSTNMGDAAANHRGSVRMLVLRPKVPKVHLRTNGSGNDFVISHDFLPNWDTELFYDRRHQLGGRIHKQILPQGHGSSALGNDNADAIVPYGITYINDYRELNVDIDPTSPTYGHSQPTRMKSIDHTAGTAVDGEKPGEFTTTDAKHGMTPFDLLTSRINTNKYAVLEDKVFTLDSLHHGSASHHVCNITIPYNKKVRFQGRKPTTTTGDGGVTTDANADALSDATFDEPLNLQSRPIVLFLSYNQRISAQVTGYTAISEC